MTLESTAIAVEQPKKIQLFPGLYISLNKDVIVFMHAYAAGTVVWRKHSAQKIGEYQQHWLMSIFEPYEGEIRIKQLL